VSEEEVESPIDIMALAFKVMEAGYFVRDNIYTVKGEYRKLRGKDKDKMIFILISYLGEFLALLGARRTVIWDEITNFQIEKYPEYEIAIDGVQVDMINQIHRMKEEEDPSKTLYS